MNLLKQGDAYHYTASASLYKTPLRCAHCTELQRCHNLHVLNLKRRFSFIQWQDMDVRWKQNQKKFHGNPRKRILINK